MILSPSHFLTKRLACAIASSLLITASLPAQEVYSTIEPAPLLLADASNQSSDDLAITSPAEGAPSIEVRGDSPSTGIAPTQRRFQYGLRLTIRGVYDDNIFLSESNRASDYYFAIEPGLTLGFGDIVGRQENYIRLDYAPSIFLFADHTDSNAVQHLFRLEGQYRFSRLTLTLSQDVQLLEHSNLNTTSSITTGITTGTVALNLDAGGDTQVDVYSTKANFSYDLSGKTSLSGGIQYSSFAYQNLISSESLSGNFLFNYNYSPKLVIGIGGTGGYNWVDAPSPNQKFEQANAHFTYQLTGKISVDASGGIEFRQSGDGSQSSHTSPVYELGATYQPFDGTSLSLHGSRRTLNSAVFVAQDYSATSITFGVTQRLYQRFFFGLTAGYENSDYFSTVEGIKATRTDDYYFVQPALDVKVTRWLTMGAYYLHRQNNSAADGFSFRDNQLGIRASVTF